MTTTNVALKDSTKVQEPATHVYNAPLLSPKEFLLAVMHDRDTPLRDRMDAASRLLRLFPYDWDAPRLTYRIEGFPSCHSLSTWSDPGPAIERTEINSHSREISQKTLNHSGEPQAPVNIETIIGEIKSGNFPTPTLCTICGEYMPFPCSTSKTL
jgi:hypothetical protein